MSIIYLFQASLVAQLVKNLPAMRETPVRSMGWEDPLEKGKATHSSILAWRIPWTVSSMGSQRVGHNWVTFTFTICQSGANQEKRSHVKSLKQGWGDLVQEIGNTCDGRVAMTDGCSWAKRLAAVGSHHHAKLGSVIIESFSKQFYHNYLERDLGSGFGLLLLF